MADDLAQPAQMGRTSFPVQHERRWFEDYTPGLVLEFCAAIRCRRRRLPERGRIRCRRCGTRVCANFCAALAMRDRQTSPAASAAARRLGERLVD
jgi:hypothetical protein